MQSYQGFHASPKTPEPLLPVGAWDCHIHTFGPLDKYPVQPDAIYCNCAATIDAALKMHKALGIKHGVIVQAAAYATNFDILYNALRKAGPGYIGCAIIDETVSDDELFRLHAAGIRGARFNFFKALNLMPTTESFLRTICRIEALGWFAKLHISSNDFLQMRELFESLTLNVVVDHFGRPDFAKGIQQPDVVCIDEFLKRGNWWMMLSNGDRWSRTSDPYGDAIEFAHHFIDLAPDRVIWGSDWPHPLVPASADSIDDGRLVELAYRYAPSENMRQKLFRGNPEALFGLKN